jgi:hypothetical protein
MQSKKINELGTNVSPSINDLTVVGDAATGQLKKITLNQIASLFGSVGGVSSVAMTVPTGLTVTGSPITTSGTLAVTLTAGYSIPTNAKQTEWDAGYAERLKWDGGASGLSAPTARTSLGLVIGTDVLAYRTFGTAASNNTGDFATAAQGVSADTAYTNRITGASLPLSISSNVISIAEASTTISGFLSSTNFNTFNGKQSALNGTGFVKATGTTISYDNTSYLPLGGGTLTGSLSYNVGDGTNWFISSASNGAELRLKYNGVSSGYSNRSGALAWKDNAGNRTDVLGWTDTSIIAYQALNGTSATFSANIGIGINSPTNKLHILGSGINTQNIILESSISSANAYCIYTNTSKSYLSGLSSDFSNSYIIYDNTSSAIRMLITNSGSLLVNSSTDLGSGYKLQVNGSISMAYANFFNFKGSSGAGDVLVDNSGSSLRVTGAVQLSDAVTFISTALVQGLLTNYNVYNTQTSSYSLVLNDASKVIEMNVGTSNTVTIPTNASVAFPIGTEITVMQYGAGVTSIAVASGVTIVSKDSAYTIANRYTGLTLIKRATNEWYIIGNIVV